MYRYGEFLYGEAGTPGKWHDRRQFCASPLYLRSDEYFAPGEYVIGDTGYLGDGPVICPYRAPLADGDDILNKVLNYPRKRVEWGFAALSNKWGIFRKKWTFSRDHFAATVVGLVKLTNRLYHLNGFPNPL